MGELEFYIVDVFAEEKYAGNQLAVFRNAGHLSSEQMQKIANETHFSETTFILSDQENNGGYDVRIFTPVEELPFAGHPTLGTAFIIKNEILKQPAEKIILNLGVGQIPVTLAGKLLWMKQIEPEFGQTAEAKKVAGAIGIDFEYIDQRFPIEEVSTGMFCLIVPLKNLNAVRQAAVDREKFRKLIETLLARSVLIFCPEAYDENNDLNVRFFAEELGVAEDPATGSANGCLAAYLVKNRYFDEDRIDIKVEQGYEISRPSLLYLRANEEEGRINVHVGGKVEMIAKGRFI
ncbi:MAG TPA: PhzF family phenazine biosynthesis protein [candidate division Zixibacteria bacterium]|nr:PhzF family phenazine biosynthesis protein [candidate division Zixibacteria bacterium]HER00155.1 PhzF family phenazine biosynthesis protein [candidate division Zixibacteria bacterium]